MRLYFWFASCNCAVACIWNECKFLGKPTFCKEVQHLREASLCLIDQWTSTSDPTSPCCVCPPRPPWTLTSSWALCFHLARFCPTTTSATSPDGDAPPVSSRHGRCSSSVKFNMYTNFLSPHDVQLVAACPPSWSRPTFPWSTTRRAPALAGGAALLRPPWCAAVVVQRPDAMWVSVYIKNKSGRAEQLKLHLFLSDRRHLIDFSHTLVC